MKKITIFIMIFMMAFASVSSVSADWWSSSIEKMEAEKEKNLERIFRNTPVPAIQFGQERIAVQKRAKLFDVPNKLGYVYVLCAGVGPIGYYTVFGKVASLNSYLVPQERIVGNSYGNVVVGDADIDGTYGSNIEGVFFFTDTGAYAEFATNGPVGYLYFDNPIAAFKVPWLNPSK